MEREFSLASVGRQNLTPVLRHATSPWLRSKWSASGPAECRLHIDLPLGGSRPSLSLCLTMLFGYAYPWESRAVLHKASGLNRTHGPVSPDRPDLDRLCIVTHIASTNGVFNFARKTGGESLGKSNTGTTGTAIERYLHPIIRKATHWEIGKASKKGFADFWSIKLGSKEWQIVRFSRPNRTRCRCAWLASSVDL